MESLCADLHPDDGADPKLFFRPQKPANRPDRKTLQLCAQVADTLNLVLSGECGDEVLQSLQVIAVKPAPDSSQLLVLVGSVLKDHSTNPATVLERLHAAAGRLRNEVAAAITRRRAPRLLFQFVANPGTAEVRP